jgi:hypothetical protein
MSGTATLCMPILISSTNISANSSPQILGEHERACCQEADSVQEALSRSIPEVAGKFHPAPIPGIRCFPQRSRR